MTHGQWDNLNFLRSNKSSSTSGRDGESYKKISIRSELWFEFLLFQRKGCLQPNNADIFFGGGLLENVKQDENINWNMAAFMILKSFKVKS